VRWGKLYRAGALSQLTDDDLAVLQQTGVRLICDLRSPSEVEQAPDRLPADGSIRYRHLPIDPDDQDKQAAQRRLRALLFDKPALAAMMRDIYIRSIEEHAEVFAAVMRELAEPDNLPLLVHCTAGKDRTGLNIAFVLLALGVPQQVIIADYTLSNMYYDHFYRLTEKLVKPLRLFGVHPDDMLPMLTADPDRLRAVLDYFDAAYGTVAAYLEYKTGLDPAVIEQVKNNLLE
jgi:protein-tyrosine phosphatase